MKVSAFPSFTTSNLIVSNQAAKDYVMETIN